MSLHKCRHCGEDIRSVRLWLPRPAGEPFWLPPPFDVEYRSLEDGSSCCRDTSSSDVLAALGWDFSGDVLALPHQPMPRIRT